MLDDFEGDAFIYIEGNTFCCICGWWHSQPIDYGHEAMLCPTCLDDWLSDKRLRVRVTVVTPARPKRAKRSA